MRGRNACQVRNAPRPLQSWPGAATLRRHFHGAPYAALVISGGYEEAGDHGRIRARPGRVLFHASWSAHRNLFDRAGARLLNLPLSDEPFCSCADITDPDAMVRMAERDPLAASALLMESVMPVPVETGDWPDFLARALAADQNLHLADWARSFGLRPETVSRGFHRAFGVTAARFRRDIRAGRAIRQIAGGEGALAEIAAECGFADQSHMNRAVKAITGVAPTRFRPRSISSKLH